MANDNDAVEIRIEVCKANGSSSVESHKTLASAIDFLNLHAANLTEEKAADAATEAGAETAAGTETAKKPAEAAADGSVEAEKPAETTTEATA